MSSPQPGNNVSAEQIIVDSMNTGQRIRNPADYLNIQGGNVDEYYSLTNLLDCCVLYYYAVAHKYIIMVSRWISHPHAFFSLRNCLILNAFLADRRSS